MNNLNIPELLELAKKATQSWDGVINDKPAGPYIMGEIGDVCDMYFMNHSGKAVEFHNAEANAQYMASLSPDKMIPLMERLMELEEHSSVLRKELDKAVALLNRTTGKSKVRDRSLSGEIEEYLWRR